MSLLTDRASILREFFRLVNADSNDADLTEHDATDLEGAYEALDVGLRRAQLYLISIGQGSRWLKTSPTLTFQGSDPRKFAVLPWDFLRLDSDPEQGYSGVRYTNGVNWGSEIDPAERHRAWGRRFYLSEIEGLAATRAIDAVDNLGASSRWALTSMSVTENATTAPNGADVAAELVEAAVSSGHQMQQSFREVPPENTWWRVGARLKANTRSYAFITLQGLDGAEIGSCMFDLSDGVIVSEDAALEAAYISDAGEGFYDCSVLGNVGEGSTGAAIRISLSDDGTNETYAGDGSSSIYAWRPYAVPAGAWGLYLARSAAAPSNLVCDYYRRVGQMEDGFAVEFLEDDRNLIPAFAAEHAMKQAWFTGGAEEKQAILANLSSCQSEAYKRGRPSRRARRTQSSPTQGRWII